MTNPFSKNEKLPRRVKKLFTPDGDFTQKAKGRFLATFDAAHAGAAAHRGTAAVHGSRFALIIKIIAVGAAAFAIFIASASVYADTTNVPIESPLYPLKRLAENVQLAVTPPAAKPQLEATLATRRASEINDLEATHPTSTLLPTLAADLNEDVTASINGATAAGGITAATSSVEIGHANGATGTTGANGSSGAKKSALESVCDTLRSAFGTASASASTSASANGGILRNLQTSARIDVYTRCGGISPQGSFAPAAGSGSNAGSGAGTSTATSTTSARRGAFPGGRRIFPGSGIPFNASSTASASSTTSSSSTRIFPPFRTFASSSISTSTRMPRAGVHFSASSTTSEGTLEGTIGL
ncbi:MAG TPA: DUF5667 domain-containing protein [Candidatus Paceibacterota bacterium]|jgi:hypothetical protein|nr:DUF5667 domain-containing protein [Candidatus Paceibacterota bacterium]